MARRPHLFQRLRQALNYLVSLVKETYEAWRDDRAIRLGAGLAYYGLLALVPLLVLAVTLAGLLFSEAEIQDYVAGIVDDTLDAQAEQFNAAVAEETKTGSTQGAMGAIGLISLVIAASFLFLAISDALKVIWDEPVRPGFKQSIVRRLLAAVVAILAGSLLLAGLVITTVLGVADRLAPDLYLLDVAGQMLITAASWALGIGFLVLLIQLLVRRTISWWALLIGGAVTALVLSIGTTLTWRYLSTSGDRSVAGVTGSIILVLIWMYYVAQMFIAGAELTKVLDWRIKPVQRDQPEPADSQPTEP